MKKHFPICLLLDTYSWIEGGPVFSISTNLDNKSGVLIPTVIAGIRNK